MDRRLVILALVAADRGAGWLAGLRWYWGLIIILAVVGPWAGAVTVATDGTFWTQAVGGDLAPKFAGGHETHGGPFGYHTLLIPAAYRTREAASGSRRRPENYFERQ